MIYEADNKERQLGTDFAFEQCEIVKRMAPESGPCEGICVVRITLLGSEHCVLPLSGQGHAAYPFYFSKKYPDILANSYLLWGVFSVDKVGLRAFP